eukprot:Sspe_Gene.54267::Locus_29954_Transcript_2_2_Confidence_0.667_Length_934::g.54267::m.54267
MDDSTKTFILKHVQYCGIGCLVAVILAWLVGSAIEEITFATWINIPFGIVLMFLSGVLFHRIVTTDVSLKTKVVVMIGNALIFASGIMTLCLKEGWLPGLTPGAKTPMYMILAMSLSFSICYVLIDLALMGAFHVCLASNPADSISSITQVYATVGACIGLGAYIGLLYGLLDVEDEKHSFGSQLLWSCLFAAVLGALMGKMHLNWQEEDASWAGISDDNDPIDVEDGF